MSANDDEAYVKMILDTTNLITTAQLNNQHYQEEMNSLIDISGSDDNAFNTAEINIYDDTGNKVGCTKPQ